MMKVTARIRWVSPKTRKRRVEKVRMASPKPRTPRTRKRSKRSKGRILWMATVRMFLRGKRATGINWIQRK